MTALTTASGAKDREAKNKQPEERSQPLKKTRVQLDFTPRSMERLNTLKAKTEATSNAEVVKNALRIYEALIEDAESGKQFLIRDENGVVSPYRLFL